MKIQSIQIKNFRQFSDVKVDFDDIYNSFVASNGVGKSTMRVAILFCLFGSEYIYDTKLFSDYSKDYPNNSKGVLFSKSADNTIDELNVKCKISFSNSTFFDIERTIKYDKINRQYSEKVHVLKKDAENNFQALPVSYSAFEKFYPRDFSVFSFIAGERINSVSEILNASSGNIDIKRDIENMFSLNKYNSALSDIKEAINIMLTSVEKNTTSDKNVEDLQLTLERNNINIDAIINEIEILDKTILETQEVIANADHEIQLLDIANDLIGRKENIEKVIEIANIEKKATAQNIITNSQNLLFKSLMSGLLENYDFNNESMRTIIPGLSQEAINYIMSEENCICGNMHTEMSLDKLEKLKLNQPPKNMLEVLSHQAAEYKKESDDYNYLMGEWSDLLLDYDEKIDENNEILTTLYKQIDSETNGQKFTKDSYTHKLNIRAEAKSLLRETEKNMLDAKRRKAEFENENKDIENFIKKYMAKVSTQEDIQILDDLQDARDSLSFFIEDTVNKISEELSEQVNKYARKIIDKDIRIEISKNYIPKAVLLDNIEGLSDGEKSVVSISYLLGLMKTVQKLGESIKDFETTYSKSFPIVLDAVFAPFGEDFIKKVVNEINEYHGQVILLNNEAHYKSIKEHLDPNRKDFIISIDRQSSIAKVEEV